MTDSATVMILQHRYLRLKRIESAAEATVEAIERGSTTAPVLEALKAALDDGNRRRWTYGEIAATCCHCREDAIAALEAAERTRTLGEEKSR